MAALGRDALLAGHDLKRERVHVGPLGGEVVFREMSVGERLRAGRRFAGVEKGDTVSEYKAVLAQVVVSLCNDDGSPMFSEAELDETVESLMEKSSSKVIEQLISECLRVQGVSGEKIKEAVGNSEEIPGDVSSSNSPEISDTPAHPLSLSA